MGRPAKFDEGRILDAALAVAAEDGPGAATIGAIAKRLGAPSGSLYHRFGSRDLLLASLWIRTVRRFQGGYVAALGRGDAEAAALHTPRWSRERPDEAAVLLLYRRQDLAATWPTELADDLGALNAEVTRALDGFIARHAGVERERLVFATIDVPYGAVRRHLLDGRPPPAIVDELVAATCRAVLRLSGG